MIQGFTVQHWKKKIAFMPVEDAFKFDAEKRIRIMAVADGVTRDPALHLPNKKTLVGQLKFALPYPRLRNHARASAKIFCDFSIGALREFSRINETAIKESFCFGNKGIKQYASENVPHVDYLKKDFPGCVAALTSETSDGSLYWGYICDAGVAIFDEKEEGCLKFKTKDDGPTEHDKDIWPLLREKFGENANWHDPKVRAYERKHFRNNPKAPSFGVLTGEESAMHYVRAGVTEVSPSDLILVYTDGLEHVLFSKAVLNDGLEHIVFSKEFADLVKARNWNGIEQLCKQKVESEGTLVYSGF